MKAVQSSPAFEGSVPSAAGRGVLVGEGVPVLADPAAAPCVVGAEGVLPQAAPSIAATAMTIVENRTIEPK